MERRDGKDLALLLQELGKLEGLRWIRLLCESLCGERAASERGSNTAGKQPQRRVVYHSHTLS